MSDEQFRQLLEILGKVGGVAYEAALRRVYVSAWLDGGLGILLGALALVSALMLRRGLKLDEENLELVIGFVGLLVCSILAVGAVYYSITSFASPEWQAIQFLAELVVRQ